MQKKKTVERKRIEPDTNEYEIRLMRALLDTSPNAFVFIDKNKIIQFYNKKAAQISLEFYNGQMKNGSSIYDYLDEKDYQDFNQHFQAALDGEFDTKLKPFKISKDGKHLEFDFQPLTDFPDMEGISITVSEITREQQLTRAHEQSVDALHQSEQRYKMLVENAFDAIYLIRNHQFEYVNKRYEQLTGYSSEEVLSPDFDISLTLTPKSKEVMENRYEARLKGEKLPSRYDFQVKRKDGKIIDVELSTASLSQNNEVLVLGIMRDISNRVLARAVIENEKAYFKHLFESLPFGVVVLNFQDVVLDCNTEFLKMFKLEKKAVIKSTITDLIVPDYLKEEGDAITSDIISGNIIAKETVRMVSDGKLLQVAINGQPMTLPDGSQIIFGIYQDITGRKKTEQALNQERDLMNALMDNIPDTIYFKDTASKFTRINQAQQKTLGVKTTDEAIGKSDFDFFDQAHSQKAFEEERLVMTKNKPMINRIEKIKTSKGWKWFSATKVPLKNVDGKIIGLAGISRDITELKLLEEALRQNEQHLKNMNAEKDKLFSIIAHDLRSPFNSFIMLTDMYMNKEYGMNEEDLQQIASTMHKSAANLSDLLDNLLDWSRLQRGLLDIEVIEFELLPLINSNIEGLSEIILNKKLTVDNQVNAGYRLKADRNMVSSIFRNLLVNAIKFTREGGLITIESGIIQSYYFFSVADNGIGMPKTILKNLFKIDGKTGRKGTDDEATSGLGMILVKEFLEKQGGYIEVQSVENEGSKMTAYLPVNGNKIT